MGKPHEQRQQEIIEAALELASEQGVKKVTTQAIADRVGIAQPTVFRHFPNRDAIFAGAIDWLAKGLFATLATFFSGHGPADERLRRLITTQLRFIEQNQGLPRILFSDRLHLESPTLKTAVRKVMDRYMAQIAELIREGQRTGRFRENIDPDAAARHVAALVQGTIMRWSILDFAFSLEAEAESLWQFMSPALCK